MTKIGKIKQTSCLQSTNALTANKVKATGVECGQCSLKLIEQINNESNKYLLKL